MPATNGVNLYQLCWILDLGFKIPTQFGWLKFQEVGRGFRKMGTIMLSGAMTYLKVLLSDEFGANFYEVEWSDSVVYGKHRIRITFVFYKFSSSSRM